MPKLMLDRKTLARLLQNDHQAIVAFEKVLGDVGGAIPSTLEEVTALASMASSLANLALEMLAKTDEQLELLRGLPTPVAPPVDENYIPAIAFGTIAQQNADSVEITGGSIDGTTIGATSASTGAFTTLLASGAVALSPANANVVLAPTGTGVVTINPATLGAIDKVAIGGTTPSSGAFTTVSATGQITSTLATGTPPLIVASTTKVSNLNSDLLDGTDWAAPGTIGGATPGSAFFTTINASGQITSTVATGTAPLVIASTTNVPNLNASSLSGATFAAPGAIGGTTPAAGAFTTVTASDQVTGTKTFTVGPALKATTTGTTLASTFAATNSDSSQFLVGYSGQSGDPSAAIWWKDGTTIRFATATNTQAAGFTQHASLDVSGLVVVAGFGCNGKTAQTAYALGAAATDLASVIILANNLRTMSINNGTGQN